METPAVYQAEDLWISGPLAVVPYSGTPDRLKIGGDDLHEGFQCGETAELMVAPEIWIRGAIEQDHTGWLFQSTPSCRIPLRPGMMVRRSSSPYWPQPETPYEGLRWCKSWGNYVRFSGGQWVPETE